MPINAAPTTRSPHAEMMSIEGSISRSSTAMHRDDDDAGGVADAPGASGQPAALPLVGGERRDGGQVVGT